MASEQPSEVTIVGVARKIESADEREAFLTEICGDDRALRRRVEQLLAAYVEESQYLEQPAQGLDATMVHQSSVERPGEKEVASGLDAGLTGAFSVDDAVVLGDKNHSVLKMLGNTMAEVPRVSLRDPAAEGDDPVSRPASPEMPKQASDQRYQLQGEIARGGMGAVLKGRDTDLGRDLAIKVLLDSHKDNPQVIQRFVEEAQIGGQLQHPGIAPVYELGQFADQRPFFSMKLVKGETLAKLLADRKDAAAERGKFIGIFEQICQTMAYAHSRGVIHRDLKPANIMVGVFGEVQVMDWGLAKVLQTGGVSDEKKAKQSQQSHSIIQTRRSAESDAGGLFGSGSAETQMGSVMGTPAYMPPEQALGEIDQLDQRADVFGLGAVLCEILTGKPPYVAKDGTHVFRMASRGKLDDCFERLESCGADADLIALTRNCLAVEPDDRPRDATSVADEVTAYLGDVETKLRDSELHRAAEMARAVEERKRRKVTLTLTMAIIAMMAIGGGGWVWFKQQEADRIAQATEKANEALGEARVHQALAKGVDTSLDGGYVSQLRELDLAVQSATLAVDRMDAADVNDKLTWQATKMLADLETQLTTTRQLAARHEADRKFRETLETIRLNASSGFTEDSMALKEMGDFDDSREPVSTENARVFNYGPALRQYEQAFRNARLNLATMNNDAAIQWVRQSAIRESVISGLDHWASLLPDENRVGEQIVADAAEISRKRLMQISDAADSDPWRKRIRSAINNNQADELAELADAENALQQSPTLIVWLAEALSAQGLNDESERLLRSAQRKHPGDFWLNHHLTWILRLNEKPNEALEFARAALAVRPDSPGAIIRVADALRIAERPDEADALYRQAIEQDPRNYAAHNNLGVSLIHQERLDEAIVAFRTSIEINRECATAYRNLGIALKDQGKLDDAIVAFRTAIEVDPESTYGHDGLGDALKENGQLDEAIVAFRTAIKVDPESTYAHISLGNALKAQNKLDEAIAAYKKAIEIDPKTASAHHGVGIVLSEQGQLDEAIAAYEKAIEIDPQHSKAHFNLGNALKSQNKLDEAIAAYKKAIEIDPKYSFAHNGLGIVLAEQGHLDEAIVAFHTAIEIDPQHSNAHNNLGYALREQGKLDEAIATFRTAIEIDPQYSKAHINLGNALKAQNKLDEAIAAYKKAIEIDPKSLFAHHGLGIVLKEQGHLDEAIVAFHTAIEIDPQYSKAHNNLGRTLREQGKLDDAIAAFNKAVEIDPASISALIGLGKSCRAKGDHEKAAEAYASLAELLPELPSNFYYLGNSLFAIGRVEEAIEAWSRCLELEEVAFQNDSKKMLGYNQFAWELVALPEDQRKPEFINIAVKWSKRICELKPNDKANFNTLGVALYRAEKWQDAIAALQESIRLGSDDPYNWLFIAMSHWQLDQKDQAKEWYDKSLAWQAVNADAAKADAELQAFFAEAATLMSELLKAQATLGHGPSPTDATGGSESSF